MCYPPLGFDLGPPHTAMAKAYLVLVERFGDDDVLHSLGREPAALGQIGNTPITTGFLVRRRGYLDCTGKVGTSGNEGLGG